MRFKNIDEVLKLGRSPIALINGTMDKCIFHSIPFLEQGYDMLLEKPITNNAQDLMRLKKVADEHHNKVMICHVLRYSPFYRKAKEIINSGKIGEIVHIQTNERVGVAA